MYGITKQDIEVINVKLDLQRKFLLNRFIDFGDENISILDFTYSANLNPKKYFAEMNNRIKSIFDYAKELNLKPVFITLTAPSKYHRKDREGNLKEKPNETAKALTQIFNKFTNLQVFQKMKKELGHGLIYFRVYEPHKSGVPHLHAMLFLPTDYILKVKKKYFSYFTDKTKFGSNKKAIDFKYTWYNSAGGAVAYMMKYVTKTFRNEDNEDLSTQHASYWFTKHNIRRFLCSRTLAPITIYRKIRHFFKKYDNDYLKVTKLIQNNEIQRLFDNTSYYYMMYNPETDEVESVNIWQKNTDLILNSRIGNNDGIAEDLIQKRFNFNNRKEKKKPLLAIVSDFEKYAFSENLEKFILLPVVPSKLSDYQLSQYFRILDKEDIKTLDLVHYGHTKNEMIKRGLFGNEIRKANYSRNLACDMWNRKEYYHINCIEPEYNSMSNFIEDLNIYTDTKPMTNQRAVAHVPLTFVVADEICYDVPFI